MPPDTQASGTCAEVDEITGRLSLFRERGDESKADMAHKKKEKRYTIDQPPSYVIIIDVLSDNTVKRLLD